MAKSAKRLALFRQSMTCFSSLKREKYNWLKISIALHWSSLCTIFCEPLTNSSTIVPTSLADAYNNYLAGIVTRFTGAETQRIVLLSFIRNKTGQDSSTEFYDIVKFDNEDYNGANGIFNNYILINQKNADSYNYIYNDTTKTSNPYDTWWEEISKIVDSLLLEDK